jgi:hypothetical protein
MIPCIAPMPSKMHSKSVARPWEPVGLHLKKEGAFPQVTRPRVHPCLVSRSQSTAVLLCTATQCIPRRHVRRHACIRLHTHHAHTLHPPHHASDNCPCMPPPACRWTRLAGVAYKHLFFHQTHCHPARTRVYIFSSPLVPTFCVCSTSTGVKQTFPPFYFRIHPKGTSLQCGTTWLFIHSLLTPPTGAPSPSCSFVGVVTPLAGCNQAVEPEPVSCQLDQAGTSPHAHGDCWPRSCPGVPHSHSGCHWPRRQHKLCKALPGPQVGRAHKLHSIQRHCRRVVWRTWRSGLLHG